MNISLIGASGFVGTRLIELLKQNSNYQLHNIDKQQSPVYPEITAIADVRNKEKNFITFVKNEIFCRKNNQ